MYDCAHMVVKARWRTAWRNWSAIIVGAALPHLRAAGLDQTAAMSQAMRHWDRMWNHRNTYVYSKSDWDLASAVDLRRRQVKELVESDQVNIKYSPGGLIDIEYGVQYLQLQHGHRHAALRSQNTLVALAALADTKLLPRKEVESLTAAYLFFRLLIDGLRIVRGHAKDLVLPPADSEAFVFLARRVGYTTESWEEGAQKLHADIQRHMGVTRGFFTTRFGPIET